MIISFFSFFFFYFHHWRCFFAVNISTWKSFVPWWRWSNERFMCDKITIVFCLIPNPHYHYRRLKFVSPFLSFQLKLLFFVIDFVDNVNIHYRVSVKRPWTNLHWLVFRYSHRHVLFGTIKIHVETFNANTTQYTHTLFPHFILSFSCFYCCCVVIWRNESKLHFRFDHIDVDFVMNIRIILRLTETESGNVDILKIKLKIVSFYFCRCIIKLKNKSACEEPH